MEGRRFAASLSLFYLYFLLFHLYEGIAKIRRRSCRDPQKFVHLQRFPTRTAGVVPGLSNTELTKGKATCGGECVKRHGSPLFLPPWSLLLNHPQVCLKLLFLSLLATLLWFVALNLANLVMVVGLKSTIFVVCFVLLYVGN